MEENLKKIWDSPLFQNLQETDPEKLLVSLKAQRELHKPGKPFCIQGNCWTGWGLF